VRNLRLTLALAVGLAGAALAGLPSDLGQAQAAPAVSGADDGARLVVRLSAREIGREARAGRVELPTPAGGAVAFELESRPVMEPGLAARHPELRSYVGRSVEDPATTVAVAVTPLGVTASVRGPESWVVEPAGNTGGPRHLVTTDPAVPDATPPSEPVTLAREASTRAVETGPPSGEVVRRTYRLALLNDPTYAAYFGTENVLAAKVALVTRLNQVYGDDLAVRFLLVDETDRLNLDTAAKATGKDGPCGASPCFTPARGGKDGTLDRCGVDTLGRTRLVLANLIGASAYDVGHLVLGVDGGGVAYLGVAGRDYSGGGCTGLPEPVGDFFYVDYVAHELGHQFGAEHTFNGAQGACGGNGTASSVEPGSGSSIMAYAGICGRDDLQPHTDPYFSQQTLDEIGAYTGRARKGVVEVQQVSLSGFDADGDTVTLALDGRTTTLVRGASYTRAAVRRAISTLVGTDVSIAGWGFDPAMGRFASAAGQPSDAGFQIVYAPSLSSSRGVERVDRPEPTILGGPGVSASLVSVAQGGPARNTGETAASGNSRPAVSAPRRLAVPVRTPFRLEGSATDPDGDALSYTWEQDDTGYGSPLLSNRKVFGPLFRQFGDNATVSAAAAQQSPSPGQNSTSTSPVRVLPDLEQVLRGRTNAENGRCPRAGDRVRDRVLDCYSEFLPTAGYRGGAGVGGRTMHFRLTARDSAPEGGGTSYADTAVRVDRSGPFLVRSSPTSLPAGSRFVVRWDVNGTRRLSRTVRIRLSTDDGQTWERVLDRRTRNDGKQRVRLPDGVTSDAAWLMVEARDEPFFDVGGRSFTLR
jgi:hypothetical protein